GSIKSTKKPRTAQQGSIRDDRGSTHASFEWVQMVDVCCAVVPRDGNYQRQTDRGFSVGDGDRENRDHNTGRCLRLRAKAPERYEIEVCCGKHHLDPNQNKDGVTTAQGRKETNTEQGRGDNKKQLKRWGHS